MKTILALLATILCAHGVPIATQVIQNDIGPQSQTLVFDLVWGPGPGPSSEVIYLPYVEGRVTEITVIDHGNQDIGTVGGVEIRLTALVPWGAYEWQILLAYGADRSLANLTPFGFGPPQTTFPLPIDPLPGEPFGGRFTYTSIQGPQGIPDTGATLPALLIAIGSLTLLRKKLCHH